MKHEIREFTTDRLKEVRQRWGQIAGSEEFAIELAPFFEWCEAHITQRSGDSHACELYNASTDSCDAIIELVNSPDVKMTKLLKLFVSPELWDVDDKRDQIVELYVNAFIKVIEAGLVKGTKNVKLYGRTGLMLSILHSIHATWPAKQTGTQASFKGRWLTITLA